MPQRDRWQPFNGHNETHLWGQAPKLSAGARPRSKVLIKNREIFGKYLFFSYLCTMETLEVVERHAL